MYWHVGRKPHQAYHCSCLFIAKAPVAKDDCVLQIELYLETGSLEEAQEKAEEGVAKAEKQGKSPEAAADMAMKFL